MNVTSLTVGPLQENCHVVVHEGRAVMVDPGDEAERLLAVARTAVRSARA